MGPQIHKFTESTAGLAPMLMPTGFHVMVPGEGSLFFHFTETPGPDEGSVHKWDLARVFTLRDSVTHPL